MDAPTSLGRTPPNGEKAGFSPGLSSLKNPRRDSLEIPHKGKDDNMKTRIALGLFLVFVLTGVIGLSAQTMTDVRFLEMIEANTRFSQKFSADMLFKVNSVGKEPSTSEFVLYENSGKSIALFKSPARDRGKAILQMNNKYWMYFPKTKRSMVLAPVASMVGHASNADVLRPPLSTLYSIKLLDSKPKTGNRVVEFTATSREAPYGRIITWYEEDKPLRSEIYARSGVLLKKIFNDTHIRNNDGLGWFSTKTRIVDGKNERNYTTIVFSNIKILKTINESWFNPNNLGRVK